MADPLAGILATRGGLTFDQAFAAARDRGGDTFEWMNPQTGKIGKYTTARADDKRMRLPRGMKESDLYRDSRKEQPMRDSEARQRAIEEEYQQNLRNIRSEFETADKRDLQRYTSDMEPYEKQERDFAKHMEDMRRYEMREAIEGPMQEEYEREALANRAKMDRLRALQNQLQREVYKNEQTSLQREIDENEQKVLQEWAAGKRKEQALERVYPEALAPVGRAATSTGKGLAAILDRIMRNQTTQRRPMRYSDRQEPELNFASGGAARLASYGRGDDTMLVHMAPSEVKSLNDLAMAAGGSLTINPTTGLPEAGFLKKLLPTLIGAGLSFIPGVGPLMAAGLVGGFETVRTGDLGKGLMAGLGAYGGAGLAGGLTAAGTSAEANRIASLGGDITGAAFEDAGIGAAATANAAPLSTMGSGLSNIASSGAAGEAARSGFMSNVGGLGGLTKYGLAAASPVLGAMDQDQPQIKKTEPMNRLEYQARPVGPTPAPDVPGYEDLGRDFGRQQRYFDPRFVDTGEKFTPTAGIPKTVTQMPTMANGGGIGNNTSYPLIGSPPTAYNTASNRPQQMEVMLNQPEVQYDIGTGQARFAEGGISNLGGYSDGGRMLRGPGDGVSDSIPATIGDRQPARLADGEFVVPARIVSEIGNGSSEAGARKLYAMMDRVQGARKKSVGKGKVAVDSKAEKLLPA